MVQGIRPAAWWEKHCAAKTTRIVIGLRVASLTALVGLILPLQKV
jgi:hypothetical protein